MNSFLDPLLALMPQNWPLFALIVARMSGLFLTAPVFSVNLISAKQKAAVAVVIAVIMTPIVSRNPFPTDAAENLIIWVAIEVLIGLSIGLGVAVLFHGFLLAGEIISTQMGLSAATIFDPASNVSSPVIGTLLYWVALAAFLALNGHLYMFHSISESLHYLPPGQVVAFQDGYMGVVMLMRDVFVIAVQISAPLMAILLVGNVAMGVLSRAVPQINVFAFGFPLTIAVGLFAMAAVLPFFGVVFNDMIADIPEIVSNILATFAGE